MIESVSEDRVRDLKFEVDLFLAKLQLINEKGTGQPSVDKKRIKENLHEFLRDDMIYFLQKLLSEHRTTFEKMMPLFLRIAKLFFSSKSYRLAFSIQWAKTSAKPP